MIKDKGGSCQMAEEPMTTSQRRASLRQGEDYPSLFKTDIGPYSRGHRQCGNIPYSVILSRDLVEDMAVRPFAYARIINISIG